MIHLDTTFYWSEPLSSEIDELLEQEPEPAISQLVELELVSALSRRVRMAEISQEEARAIVEQFQTDLITASTFNLL